VTRLAACAIAALAALPGCELYLDARSQSPPGRIARLDEVNGFWGVYGYRIAVSHGVALAISCVGSCEHVSATSDDSAIAELRPATLGTLEHTAWTGTQSPATTFLVVGKAPGATTVHVVAGRHRRDVTVTVLAPPGPALARE
jgi:hypothetical protein